MEMVAPAGPMYQAGTLSGNPLAMTAGIKTLEILARPGEQLLLSFCDLCLFGWGGAGAGARHQDVVPWRAAVVHPVLHVFLCVCITNFVGWGGVGGQGEGIKTLEILAHSGERWLRWRGKDEAGRIMCGWVGAWVSGCLGISLLLEAARGQSPWGNLRERRLRAGKLVAPAVRQEAFHPAQA